MKKISFIILLLLGVLKAQADCTTGTVVAPIIDSVSVLPNGDVIVCWNAPSPIDNDLDHYDIWTIDNTGANLLIGTISAFPLTPQYCFTYPAPNSSGSQSIQILVIAVDNCPAPGPFSSPFNPAGFVNTVYVQGTFDKCSSSVGLSWSAYDDFELSVVRYEVSVSINGAAAIFAGTTFSTTYNYLGITAGNTYDFYVTAVENGGLGPFKSTSNIVSPDVTTALSFPQFNYLHNVTVIDSQQIDIQFVIDTTADVKSYSILRSTNKFNSFVNIGSVVNFQGMDTLVDFSDMELKPDSTNYYYKIITVNDCDVSVDTSNLGSSIYLHVSSSPVEALNTLTITEYIDWDLGVLRYDVYRATGGFWETAPVKSLPAFTKITTYVDDVSEVFTGDGEFCYKVIAVSKGIPALAESTSNESCDLHEPLLYVSNAFAPLGLYNTEFKPILTFADPTSYTFKVYNRWGQVVFQTSDVAQGWNGRFNNSGNLSPGGIYVYTVDFQSVDGEFYSKKGSLTLVD